MRLPSLAAILLLTAPVLAPAQITAPGVDADATAVSASFRMDGLTPGELGIGAGFSLEGFLDLGVSFGMGFAPLAGTPSRDIAVAVFAAAAILRQDITMPVSFVLSGTYGRLTYDSTYLDSNALIRTGSRFGVGAEIYRDFAARENLFVRAGLFGEYLSTTHTTEATVVDPDAADPVEPVISSEASYRYGLLTGVTWIITPGIALSFFGFAGLDGDTRIVYGPRVRLASWKAEPAEEPIEETPAEDTPAE